MLGSTKLEDLTAEQVRKWHAKLAKASARVRTKKGAEQKFRTNEDDPERERRRKSTANRILTILKAALNRSWRDGHVASDRAWRRVEPFKNVESARIRYLALDEATRFVNAADEDFRKLVRGALETGARYGELCGMLVADYNSDAGTVSVPDPKTGKPRHIVLSFDGVDFFDEITAGRGGAEPIFLKADGSRWLTDHQSEPMRETNKRARISPPINFHGLRHTWASHAVMNGMPLLVVAKNLGHPSLRPHRTGQMRLAASGSPKSRTNSSRSSGKSCRRAGRKRRPICICRAARVWCTALWSAEPTGKAFSRRTARSRSRRTR